jgi:hypothetical protein
VSSDCVVRSDLADFDLAWRLAFLFAAATASDETDAGRSAMILSVAAAKRNAKRHAKSKSAKSTKSKKEALAPGVLRHDLVFQDLP